MKNRLIVPQGEGALRFYDPEVEEAARIAKAVGAEMMPFVQYSEQAILNGLFGNFTFQGNQTISAPAAATTSVTIRGTVGSGSADATPGQNSVWFFGTPGTGASINQYTNADVLTATSGSTGTSMAISSQTVGKSRAVGDSAFSLGTVGAPLPAHFNNTYYIGLSTAAASVAQATILAGEPTSTGSYARIVVLNNRANFPSATAASPSVMTLGGPFSFAASGAAWSTGATNLVTMFIADASTLAGGNIIAAGTLGTPQAVNSAGITLSFGAGAITISLT